MASDAAKSLRSRAAARSAKANLMVPSRAADRSEPPVEAKAASKGSQPKISSAPRISLAFLAIAALSLSVIA